MIFAGSVTYSVCMYSVLSQITLIKQSGLNKLNFIAHWYTAMILCNKDGCVKYVVYALLGVHYKETHAVGWLTFKDIDIRDFIVNLKIFMLRLSSPTVYYLLHLQNVFTKLSNWSKFLTILKILYPQK